LFWGGRHFTALVTRQLFRRKPSSVDIDTGALLKPYLYMVSYNRIPAWSPVNGLPLAFAPCIPGASPTISNLASGSPNGGTGRA